LAAYFLAKPGCSLNGDDLVETTQPDKIGKAHKQIVLALTITKEERNIN